MLPRRYQSRSVGAPGLQHAARLSSDYQSLELDGPPFTTSDAVSLVVAREGHRVRRLTQFADYYEKAVGAVLAALELPAQGLLFDALEERPDPLRRAKGPLDLEGVSRHHGIRRLLWMRACITEFQDPWQGVLEGDVWGLRFTGAKGPGRDAIDDAVGWYHAEADRMLEGIVRIDRALGHLTGWRSERSVPVRELVERWGLPDPNELFEL